MLSEIAAGSLPPGTRLPPERELAIQMGVSRTILREALSGLQLLGVIRRVAGDGTYVQSWTEPFSANQGLSLGEGALGMARLYQAREALEIGVVAILLEKDSVDLSACWECIAGMGDAVRTSERDRYLELNLNFHVRLAEATRNPILAELTASLVSRMHDFDVLLEVLHTNQSAERSVQNHEGMLLLLERKDAGVIQAVSHHYRDYPWTASLNWPTAVVSSEEVT
ncbi:MAG: FadR/GntR family transcriptional regulator [Actinomycetota bacterium]